MNDAIPLCKKLNIKRMPDTIYSSILATEHPMFPDIYMVNPPQIYFYPSCIEDVRCCCCNRINCHLSEFSHQRSEGLTSDQWPGLSVIGSMDGVTG